MDTLTIQVITEKEKTYVLVQPVKKVTWGELKKGGRNAPEYNCMKSNKHPPWVSFRTQAAKGSAAPSSILKHSTWMSTSMQLYVTRLCRITAVIHQTKIQGVHTEPNMHSWPNRYGGRIDGSCGGPDRFRTEEGDTREAGRPS